MNYLADSVGTFHVSTDNTLSNRKYEYLDLTEKDKINVMFEKHKPKRVFLAAANPYVDGCENPETDKVNINGVSSVIENCGIYDAQVVFFSSSYVFNGKSQTPYKPHDLTEPINRYGRQKELIEGLITSKDRLRYLIIRTVGVFGKEGRAKNFVSQVTKAISENKRIRVPLDQTMNPIWSMDLARISIHLSDRYSNEVFHVAGDKCLSKYEWAIKIAYKAGYKKPHDIVVGVESEEMKQMAIRPSNGCLDSHSLTARAMSVPNLEKGLAKFLDS